MPPRYPLHEAILEKQWDIVKLLLDKGADPNLYIEFQAGLHKKPLEIAIEQKAPEYLLNAIKAKGGTLE